MDQSIQQAQESKLALETQISHLLSQFSEDTRLTVDTIRMDTIYRLGAMPRYAIKLDITL